LDQLDYYAFMGYSAEALKERYRTYAERFPPGARVLDLGCGRGEFLELLRERGADGLGVDPDSSMNRVVRERGLRAVQTDALAYLPEHPGEFDGVFAAHLVEHLPAERLPAFVAAAAAALRAGGRLILVTPNPANLQMQLNDFWIDLQHVRLYSPDSLRLLVHLAGLREIEHGLNQLYKTGPELGLAPPPALPAERPAVKPIGRERLGEAALPPSLLKRVRELEERVNQLTGWVHSLYPPGEYFVTGVR